MEGLIEKGVYVAQYGESGALIAMDEYVIEKIPNGFKIESENNVFGQNGFRQSAEILLDNQWMMCSLHIIIDDKNIELNAIIDNGYVKITQRNGHAEITKRIPLQFSHYFFIHNGALVMPLIWFRGFNFMAFEKIQYQVLPVGMAEVMQIKQPNGSDFLHFSLHMQMGDITGLIRIKTDRAGKILLYESALSKLIIKPQLVC